MDQTGQGAARLPMTSHQPTLPFAPGQIRTGQAHQTGGKTRSTQFTSTHLCKVLASNARDQNPPTISVARTRC